MPIFEKIRNNDPESGPFLDPVNPDRLGIPVSAGAFYFYSLCTKILIQVQLPLLLRNET